MASIFDFFWSDGNELNNGVTHGDTPPIELFKQCFTEATYDAKAKLPDELIKLDIEILSLADSKHLGQKEDIEYVAKFLSNFCKNSENYRFLSKDGKERIDSIFCEKSLAVQKAVVESGCISS